MRIVVLFGMMLLQLHLAAQGFPGSVSYKTARGVYTVSQFTPSVYRIQFSPQEYKRGEQVSDAVLLKPMKLLKSALPVRFSGDTVFIRNKALVSGYHLSDENKGLYCPLEKNEKLFGAGERAIPLNRRGYRLKLYNNPWYGYAEGADNLNYSVPFITSSAGYGLFFDNAATGYVDLGKADPSRLEFGTVSGPLSVYVIFGDYQQILRSYFQLTGTQPLPPRWALGNLMSRFGYTSEEQVRSVYQKMKEERIPVDAIIFDLFWFGDSIKGTLGNLDWVNQKKWPNPEKMISDFKNEGVKTILVTEPFVLETAAQYKSSLPYLATDSAGQPYYLTDFYFGKGGLIDIFRKDAQGWFWTHYKKQMDKGVEAWWGDLGEPEKHPANLYHDLSSKGFQRRFRADEVHNIYGHTWTKMLYENYARSFPDKRLFSLNRSGFAGTQRYSIFPWTGDVSRGWSGLRAQLPILLGMSMSGVPYVHSDAGGFAGGSGDEELYVRWLQFAVFTPVFRPHGTALYEIDTAAFSFPSEAALISQPYRTRARNAIGLRYLFLPYNYSLAYQQTTQGKPLISPMFFYFPKDSNCYKAEQQYMWGEHVLVAPVMEKGQDAKDVYLPEGRWMDLFSGVVKKGGQWIKDVVIADRIPIYIREGSIIPTVSQIGNTSEYLQKAQFLLNFFPSSKPSQFTWFEDDGESKSSLSTGKYTLFQCSGQDKGQQVLMEVKPSNTRFVPRMLAASIRVDKRPTMVFANGQMIPLVNNPGEAMDKSRGFALWMPMISAVQVYSGWGGDGKLKIVVNK